MRISLQTPDVNHLISFKLTGATAVITGHNKTDTIVIYTHIQATPMQSCTTVEYFKGITMHFLQKCAGQRPVYFISTEMCFGGAGRRARYNN